MLSSEMKPIILYDIPCTTPGRPWSPNTMRTRYCLGYKKLPFTTVWVELPDIAGLLQSKGVTHPPYTLPAIEDPNTDTFVVDSVKIAAYLDETYLGTPAVLGTAARAVLDGVGDLFSFGSGGGGRGSGAREASVDSELAPRLVFLVLASERLNPVSKAYYHRTRAARLGEQWTVLANACAARPEERAERIKQGVGAIERVWRRVTALYGRRGESADGTSESGDHGPTFALGGEPCFLDFAVAGRVKFALDALRPSEAEVLRSLGGGRLVELVEDLEEYYEY